MPQNWFQSLLVLKNVSFLNAFGGNKFPRVSNAWIFLPGINSLSAYYKSERCLKVINEIILMEIGQHHDVQKRSNGLAYTSNYDHVTQKNYRDLTYDQKQP